MAVIGEPAVGKSRLFWEFMQSHRTQGWLQLESRSVSYGKATAYLPVCDLLKAYCHIEDRDDLRTVRAKVTGQILTLDEALQETVPAVLALFEALPSDSPFLSLDPLQRRRRTLEALKRLLLLREGQVQPLLLVFEDLHWIDTETQAVLDLLVESLPTARILLLVNYRPEYHHSWGSKTFYTQLRLDSLPPASTEELLQTLLGHDPSLEPLRPRVIAQTQGNPFFLEESVRTLVEMKVLVGDRGAYRLAKPLDDLQVSATVQTLLAARIDRLPPEDKRLLQTAAVIGTEVPWPLLQAIADTAHEALYRSLAHLQAAEFLYETSLFPERGYTFKHALTHEVAYGSLLHERRRALHARIVEALEVLAPERVAKQVERMAHHAVRGEVWDKAVTCCQQAGARAWDRAALREAVASFDQALQALDHLREPGDTRVLAIELLAKGDLEHAIRVFDQGLAVCRASGNRDWWRAIVAGLGYASALQGHLAEGRTLVEEGISESIRTGGLHGQPHRVAWLSEVCRLAGHHDEARQHARQALDQARRLKDRGDEALALHQLGTVHAHTDPPDVAPAEAHYQQALALAEALGMRPLQAHGHLGLGTLYAATGQREQARPELSTAIDLYRAMDMTFWLPQAETMLAQVEGR